MNKQEKNVIVGYKTTDVYALYKAESPETGFEIHLDSDCISDLNAKMHTLLALDDLGKVDAARLDAWQQFVDSINARIHSESADSISDNDLINAVAMIDMLVKHGRLVNDNYNGLLVVSKPE